MKHNPHNQNRKLISKATTIRRRLNPFLENMGLFILLLGILAFTCLALMHFNLLQNEDALEMLNMM